MDIVNFFAIVGGLTGLAGFAVSISARHETARSNQIAIDSQGLATRANELAAESVLVARSAHKLAVETNQISKREEERRLEQNLVTWSLSFPSDAVCRITNTGQHDAFSVSATSTIADEHISQETNVVKPGGYLDFRHVELLLLIQDDLDRYETEKRKHYSRMDEVGASTPFLGTHFPRKFNVEVSVKWQTNLGVPKETTVTDLNHSFIRQTRF